LSALRDLIQSELGAQLGRSKATFRLWQDKEAIAPGKLWEAEINAAVQQSLFFIPVVTPRMVNSAHCQFEFDAFLARERALGRTDLVFPILYVPVPGLANKTQQDNHPVLSYIAKRQYVDWQTFRYSDVTLPATLQEVARFCNKIVEALMLSWVSPEERALQEEAAARARAEEERRREEAESRRRAEEEARRRDADAQAQRLAEERRQADAEAKLRADEEERRKRAEAEARQRAEKERRAGEAEAKQRAEQDRTFAAAKRADSVGAMEKFLAAYPASHLVTEAAALRTMLLEREETYGGAMRSDDAAVLEAFLNRYPTGKPADEVRKRLRRLGQPAEPAVPRWRMPVDAILGRTGTAPLASNQAPCFPVSLLKLAVMSICTFGMYQVYWFYKNWNLIKQRQRSNILPFWRTFFTVLFCYQCFDEIREQARKLALPQLPPAGPLAAGWIITNLLFMLPVVWIFSFVFILPVQRVANRINSIATPHHEVNQRFTGWNWVGIALGAIWLLLAIIGTIVR
jgi:hypothetical protein